MPDPDNNPQTASQKGQDSTKDTDKTNQQGQENQNDVSDKDKNFEAVRKQLADKDKIIAKYEKEKADAEKKKLEEEGELKKLLDLERKEKEDLATKYKSEKRQSLLEKELTKSGMNTEFVDLIVPSILSQVEFDDSNNPKNLSEVVENLKTTKPSLFVAQKATPAGKVGSGVATGQNSQSLSNDEVMKVIASGNADAIAQLKL